LTAHDVTVEVEKLSDGPGDRVLVLDFLGNRSVYGSQGAGAARLGHKLAALCEGHRPVYQADPVSDLSLTEKYTPLDDLAESYRDSFAKAATGGSGITVVGYCATAALAMCLADRLAKPQQIRTVLLQPSIPDWGEVKAEFNRLRENIGIAPAGTVDAARSVASSTAPRTVLEEMSKQLRQDIVAMAEREGLADCDALQAELLDRYRAWLGFLLCTRQAVEHGTGPELRPLVAVGPEDDASVPWAKPGSFDVMVFDFGEGGLFNNEDLLRTILACAL
jgi:hypothetical protein